MNLRRPTIEVYHDGLIRDRYTDTAEFELVPLEPMPWYARLSQRALRRIVPLRPQWHRAKYLPKKKRRRRYKYGSRLATNLAAPMIVRLRKQAAREARIGNREWNQA